MSEISHRSSEHQTREAFLKLFGLLSTQFVHRTFIGDAEATINWSVTVCKTIYPRTFALSHLTAWRVAPRWKAKWRVYSRTLGFTVGWSSFWLRTLSLIFNRAGICGVLGEHSFRIRHVRYYVVYLHLLTSFSYDHTVVSRMKTMFSYLKFVD